MVRQGGYQIQPCRRLKQRTQRWGLGVKYFLESCLDNYFELFANTALTKKGTGWLFQSPPVLVAELHGPQPPRQRRPAYGPYRMRFGYATVR